MRLDAVKRYLDSKSGVPFFLFVGDEDYADTQDELRRMNLELIDASDFCRGGDGLPDTDALIDRIKGLGASAFVRGLGEYLGLMGAREAVRHLGRLKDLPLGGARAVLLLRGMAGQAKELQMDPRFDERRHCVVGEAGCGLSFIVTPPSMKSATLLGFKAMLSCLEDGRCGAITVNTAANLDNPLFAVKKIKNAYEGVCLQVKGFALPSSCGSEANWDDLLSELGRSNSTLDGLFEKHGFSVTLDSNFYAGIAGGGFRAWLYFIFLKCRVGALPNGYLRQVLEETNEHGAFERNVLHGIIKVHHEDGQFARLYRERKALIKGFPDAAMMGFCVSNRKYVSTSIYKLTDNSKPEQEEIIAWMSKNGAGFQIGDIYPLLAAYLKRYVFRCSDIAGLLTDYFEAYKRQKLANAIEPDFLKRVDDLARSPRKFDSLPTRNEVLDGLPDRAETRLYWLDALGAEYLGLIEVLAQGHGLAIKVYVARAELPTLTTLNRGFFDAWQGGKTGPDDRLDEIKHKKPGARDPQHKKLPVHIAEELEVIRDVMDNAAVGLRCGEYKRFLLVSDHGASRLAALDPKGEKYETELKNGGEHSGRCCRVFSPCDNPYAIEENGYLTLADYGRFKGGRLASVEVHGGASLEEIIVPIVELTLRDDAITVELVGGEVEADKRSGAVIELFINVPAADVSVTIGGVRYAAEKEQKDANHHIVRLPDMRRAGAYPADVYSGDTLLGRVTIKARGKSAKVNEDFDSLF
jgi:hypothetical protein